MLRRQPRHRREVPVPLVQPPPFDLCQPAEPLDLEQLHRAMQLLEVFLYARVRQFREFLDTKRASEFQDRLEHMFVS
jgi:hypothetical protein